MFTTKRALGYVTASFLIASAIAGPADAGLYFNGIWKNGWTNGMTFNGWSNGMTSNGMDKDGVNDKDRETRGFDFNGVTTRSVILNYVPQRWGAK